MIVDAHRSWDLELVFDDEDDEDDEDDATPRRRVVVHVDSLCEPVVGLSALPPRLAWAPLRLVSVATRAYVEAVRWGHFDVAATFATSSPEWGLKRCRWDEAGRTIAFDV